MWNLKKKDTNQIICRTGTDFENKLMISKGDSWGRAGLGVWDWHMHTEVYGMHGQKRPAV